MLFPVVLVELLVCFNYLDEPQIYLLLLGDCKDGTHDELVKVASLQNLHPLSNDLLHDTIDLLQHSFLQLQMTPQLPDLEGCLV